MEERVEISILLDLYRELLTDKQKDIMNLYYNEDLSLAEIAEINSTSRQAIHDTIKRCCKMLVSYENTLHLLQKTMRLEQVKNQLIEKIENLQDKETIDEIKKDIIDIENIIKEDISI